jgi:hypothetical protein
MGLFKKNPGAVPNRAASPNRRPVQSADQWVASLKQKGAATPQGQALSAAVDKKLAQNAWESNQSKMRAAGDAAWKAKYDKPEPKQKQSGGWVHAEGGRAISTERM